MTCAYDIITALFGGWDMFEILKSIILGIVQGVTEWLPVSSTGHLIIVDEFLKLGGSEDFVSMFDVVIQVGSILAVVVLFFGRLWPWMKSDTKEATTGKLKLWLKIIIASVPAAVVGLVIDDFVDEKLHWYLPVAIALIAYGVAFIVIERLHKNKEPKIATVNDITYKDALFMGCFQMLALIPGTSRSGSTIIGAMVLGISRTAAAEFSFFMAVPVMFGASGLKLVKYLASGATFTGNEIAVLLVGMAVAFVVSFGVIKALMSFVKKHSFESFGWYRIVLGIAVIITFLLIIK